jgi:uncharacterized protein YacL
MNRTSSENQESANAAAQNFTPGQNRGVSIVGGYLRAGAGSWSLRVLLAASAAALCYVYTPFGLRGIEAAGAGFLAALIILLAELRLRHAETSGLMGGVVGALLGIVAALLVTLLVSHTGGSDSTKSFLDYSALLMFGYLGLMLGAAKGIPAGVAVRATVASAIPAKSTASGSYAGLKLLDTSVLIDGRIADICETHFLDGTLLVPQFVLRELQLVADSADSLKRQRGRRGLEVLQRIQKMNGISVRILEDAQAPNGDVDHELIALARRLGAKIVTTDFNLNKVATVQGLSILNVNLLANALRPAVLPGEAMRVFILREGKEMNQGVAYLDDGTMVVVDGARRTINKTVDIIVTSVHQTPAGKMIFGRLDERGDASPAFRAAAAGPRPEGIRPVGGGIANDRGPRPMFPEPDAE